MKKILKAVALLVCLLLPLSAMAMETIADKDLSSVTGQAGVSINLDANINLQIDAIAWGDKDGLGTTEASGAGWIGVEALEANVRIKLRDDLINGAFGGVTDGALTWGLANGTAVQADIDTITPLLVAFIDAYNTMYSTTFTYTLDAAGLGGAMSGALGDPSAVAGYPGIAPSFGDLVARTTGTNADGYAAYETYEYYSGQIQPLTIDVATDSTTNHGVADTTFVRIGLGSIGIYVSSMDLTPALGSSAATLDQELGALYIGDLTVLINKASYVDIYNGRATGQGVTLGMNVVIDEISVDELSWGDEDGFTIPEGSTLTNYAGYVGLQNTTIAGLEILGPVAIDVATSAVGGKEAGVATTFVRIGFDGLNVKVGDLDSTVVLSRTKDFTGATDTLGSIYMSDLDITFDTGYVDIYNYNGKSGVVLDFGLAIASFDIDTISWGDADGVSAGFTTTNIDNPGYVGLKDLNLTNLTVGGIVTIDVATVLASDAAPTIHAVNTTFVRIGFDDLAIGIDSMDATVALGTAKDALAQELGSIYMSTLDVLVNGNLDISSHVGTQGVVFDMDLDIDVSNIAAVSWGDDDVDGIGAAAGFVGLKDLTIGTMTVVGKVAIDVAHVVDAPTSYGLLTGPQALMYAGYYSHLMSPVSTTFVHIALGSGDATDNTTTPLAIGISNLGFDIALDSVATLANAGLSGTGMLGSVYMGGVDVRVNGWVDIAAH